MTKSTPQSPREREPVPLFGSWPRAYLFVIGIFALDVAAFYFFGRYFS